jgi:hypothetical protein
MIVKSCRTCPFFTTTLLTLFAQPNGGECSYIKADDSVSRMEAGISPGPERDAILAKVAQRLRVIDAGAIPAACPLRERDIVVTLGVN